MNDIFVRAFTDNKPVSKPKDPENHNKNIQLILDTETTVDQYQNLTFGSCLIQTDISTGIKEERCLFYGDIPDDKRKIIEDYGSNHSITVLPIKEFIDKVFYPYAYRIRAEVIGFNLPFDLSRLAIGYGIARKTKDGFSLKLSEDARNPRIRIQSIDQKRSFISFLKPLRKKSDRKYKPYSGFFVDLKTLTFALTDKSHSLDSACKDFSVSQKTHTEEHGKITEGYIDYNINDVRITAELYEAALQRYRIFNLKESVNRLYSPASIGKAYLRKIGIKSFTECNSDFSKDVLGFTMSTYYGGRTEVRIRNKPIPVSYLDFTSMYPSVYSLLELDKFLKSDRINVHNNTDKVKEFLSEIKIKDLANPEIWHRNEMHSIIQIRPNDDILPVRMEYSKEAKNIGINYLTSNKPLWYTIQDVIASLTLTGKIPEIITALTFIPEGMQKGLHEVNISDITIKPDEDFIRKVIEERIRVKKSDNPDRDQIQLILKIIANATSYGIYIEENPRDLNENKDMKVYSVDAFHVATRKIETQGLYFNPIMASLITGSARLILAIAEHIAESSGYMAYCDTDSVFVKPETAKEIQDFFRPLNPYSANVEMFKIEKDDSGNPLDNVLFYGISAKRYCLYQDDLKNNQDDLKNNQNDSGNQSINILKYSTHGLGHLMGIDGKQIWKDILNNTFDNYQDKMAVSQITITKPSILNRFRALNNRKPLDRLIKPFNFMLIGSQINDVIPSLPFTKDITGIQYRDFIDYRSGKSSKDLLLPLDAYWKSLEDILIQYVRHNDNKFSYVDGIAKRKHITLDRIRYIGKESNNLDEVNIFGVEDDSVLEYGNLREFYEWVMKLKPMDVKRYGVSKMALWKVKDRIRHDKKLNFKTKIVKILIQKYKSAKQTT